jgi:outer membrane protein assembly factor BamB
MKTPSFFEPQSLYRSRFERGRRVFASSAGLAFGLLLQACSGSKPPKPTAPLPTAGGPSIGRVAWSLNAGSMDAKKNSPPVNFAPVYAAGSIWFAAADGAVGRVDAKDGALGWKVNVGKPLVAGVGTDSETVVVAARDGTLIALDGDGKTRWTAQNSSEAMSVPAVGLGIAVVRFSDNRIYGFDSETGKRRWQVQRQSPALVLRQTNSMAIDTAAVYVGMPGGRLMSISVKTGAVRWEAAVSQAKGANEIERIADVVGTPLLSGRELCAATYQGKLACFDAATGRTLWARDLPAKSGIEIDNRIVCAVDDLGNVIAFSRAGTVLWRQTKLAQRSLSAPISVDGHLLLGDEEGYIYVLSRDNGDIVGRISTDGSAILAAPCAAEKLAVFQTSRGGIYAVSLG